MIRSKVLQLDNSESEFCQMIKSITRTKKMPNGKYVNKCCVNVRIYK